MRDINELKPYGKAWKSILRVRLFHARVRYQLLLKNRESTEYQMIPINQLHLLATLLGFQYTPLVVLRTIFGIPITEREMEAYTALWRYIGYIIGCVEWQKGGNDAINEQCIPLQSFAMSRSWMAKVWDNLINPDINASVNSTTLMLSAHVLKAIALSTIEILGDYLLCDWEKTIAAFFRAFLTEKYANMIQLTSIHWSYEIQIRVIIAFIRINHIIMYQLHLNWMNLWLWRHLYKQVMMHVNYNLLEKRENYKCRFAKYCNFR